jgi:ribosomal protein L11 methyltransferase
VLAIAARRLGAAAVRAIDVDEDALDSARETLALNPQADGVLFEVGDVAQPASPSDVVLANLTGALLVRSAAALCALATSGGALILSGFQPHEADEVLGAFAAAARPVMRTHEGEWEAVLLRRQA